MRALFSSFTIHQNGTILTDSIMAGSQDGKNHRTEATVSTEGVIPDPAREGRYHLRLDACGNSFNHRDGEKVSGYRIKRTDRQRSGCIFLCSRLGGTRLGQQYAPRVFWAARGYDLESKPT